MFLTIGKNVFTVTEDYSSYESASGAEQSPAPSEQPARKRSKTKAKDVVTKGNKEFDELASEKLKAVKEKPQMKSTSKTLGKQELLKKSSESNKPS
jgi:hypothetical protein